MENIKKVSKFLSLILRHKPQTIGLTLDSHGWAEIDELLSKSKIMKLNREILDKVVKENDKQRFIIDGDRIRANQGHSLDIDLELKVVTPPNLLFHGTATQFIASIMKIGLIKQRRQHVHLSEKRETAISVGRRHGEVVLLKIDSQKMFDDGYDFYLSENGVWLTDVVPFKYLSKR